ncbi:MAG: RNase adapter RapZ [Actinobacteria bacterium]|nr:RNase adapter RapZ [Actinomycetota bacterium]MDQ3217692.1 RNase adapter RapZ [Actinomycetota bacterium]
MSLRQRAQHVDVLVISGLSGAGRSEAAKALEDLGWFVVDNLPPALIKTMVSLALAPGNDIDLIALVIDARGGTFFSEAMKELEKLRRDVCNYRLVFLEASDDALVRRFDASRRRHPLAPDDRVAVGIQRERDLMRPFREGADIVVDTSDMSVRALRTRLGSYFSDVRVTDGLSTTVISFGYKYGLPLDADLVFDVRFLPNPHWVPDLRPLTGLEQGVKDYVLGQTVTAVFMDRLCDLLMVLLNGYQEEGRHYLTVAIGCTGGRHRSVVLSEAIAATVRDLGFRAKVVHRDVERPQT